MSFIDDAIGAGFTKEQAEFLYDRVAPFPHNHSIDEVDGLPEALEEEDNDLEDEEEEEEE